MTVAGVPGCAVTIDGDRQPVNAATVQLSDHDGFFLAPVLTPVAGGIEARSGSGTAAVSCATFPVLAFSVDRISLRDRRRDRIRQCTGPLPRSSPEVRRNGVGARPVREGRACPVARGRPGGCASGDCRAGQGVVEAIRRSRRDYRVAAKRLARLLRGQVREQPPGQRARRGGVGQRHYEETIRSRPHPASARSGSTSWCPRASPPRTIGLLLHPAHVLITGDEDG